ncbi:SDR family NAD(P)-dependent oxidoreductase, partial [Streptomyces sp. SID3212]|uniref:SDR family NAD(P)-dependent oxidoreductase n=1 Tax=Streptomyces sp. SID3212 TaxID=2690259 RepID=UPI00136F7FB6|nr:SDR family NAD(P)-dependent oxidoreductase [Streptomyces sp. SID3212]
MPAAPAVPAASAVPAETATPTKTAAPADIAVIGMSGRFPDAPDLPAFWSNLVAGHGSVREVPAERWDIAQYYDTDRRAEGRTYSKWAALLDDVDQFDAGFFHLSPMEAEQMDPQQRLFLQEAWSALEDAGYAVPGAERASCGVFIGSGAGDYLRLLEANGQDGTSQAFLGNSPSILAARIAYHLNLGGPAVAIDTACSSSLVAVHQAVTSIRSGECETAVAGGVAVMLTPRMHVWTSSAGMLSPTGRCAPFDSSADGIVLGEGVGAVVLKPLDRALADGDTVYAVIKATGSNSDGRTNGITAPSADSQAALLMDVYRRAGLSLDEVGYVEAHGTGTALGDPIEVKALTQVFGDRAASAGVCHLGSVKSNIGHTTLASGIAGFIKVVLGLRAGRIAPSLNFATPNPKIDFERGPFRVPTTAIPWPPGPSGLRVGAVSSFGFSGTNAHVVLAEAPPQAASAPRPADEAVVLPLSARTADALHHRVRQLTERLTEQHDLGDTARTLALSRAHFPVRAAFVIRNLAELREQAQELLTGGRPPTDIHGERLMRLAEDYLAGRDVDWTTAHAGRPRRNVPLPTYPFARTRHWTVGPATARPAESDPTTAEAAARPKASATSAAPAAVRPGVSGTSAAPTVVRPGASDTSAAPGVVGPAEPGPATAAAVVVPVAADTSVAPAAVRPTGSGTSAASAVAKAAESGASTAPVVVRPGVSGTSAVPGVVGPAESGPATAPAVVRPVGTGTSAAPAVVQPAESHTSPASVAVPPEASGPPGASAPPTRPAVANAAALSAAVTDAPAVVATTTDGPAASAIQAEVPPEPPAVADAPAKSPPATPSPDHPLLICRPAWYEDAAPPERLPDGTSRRVALACADGDGPLADALAGLHPHDEVIRIPLGGATPAPGPFDVLYVLAGREGPVPELTDTAPTGDPVTLAAFYLLKQLLRFGQAARPLAVTFVVHGVLPVTPEDRVLPHGAGLVGLSRTVAAEHPLWRVRCVDIDPYTTAADPSRAARRIVAEDGTHPVVALRGARRYLRRFEPLAPGATGPTLRDGGVYLVVGGAGGLGRAMSEHLAAVHGARLLWLGRRPGDDPEVLAGTAEIIRLGGEIRYVRGDVTDPVAVRAAVARARQDFGALHGVLHAAGELRDVPLARMTEADFTRVLAAKAVGAAVLIEALADERPDFCVLFSSAASFVASPGQANYAAAATLEDAYAWQARGRDNFPVSVVNWGFWGTVGAVSDERYHRSFAALGVGSIDPAEGFAALRTALSSGVGQALVIKADPARLAGHGMPLATNPAPAATDPVPTTTGDPTSQGNSEPDPDLERRARDYLKRVFAGLLKCGEDEITDRETLDNIGVDSLLGAEIIDLFSADLGELPATLLFEHATIERLATHLLEIRRERLTAVLTRDEEGPAHPAAPAAQPTDSPDPAPATATGEANPVAQPTPHVQTTPDAATPSASPPTSAPHSDPDHNTLDIAVVGVTGRYPGAPDLDTFARNLAAGANCVTEVPADRWDWRAHFDPRRGRPNRTYGKWAGFLDGIDEFDPQLFGILPREAAAIDPQERLFLETCWNLLEETGYLGEHTRVPETGVFVGLMYGSYGQLAAASGWNRGEFGAAHSAYWSVANRASYVFDLTGPSFAVDSACSSSLTAVHLACESLRRGECRMAVAGGVNLILHPAHLVALAGRGMLASGDACRTFDAGADGYVPGEGVGAVLLKPLAEAKADGDRIWAVIKASRSNAGGKTSGYTVPNPNAQAALVARTLEEAGVDPRTIGYVEAHGTGTALGDPIEVVALTHAFGSGSDAAHRADWDGPPVTIGSVKANIGHLEGAAGIAGLTKVLLQLRDGMLYPSANLERINPKIDFDGSPFRPLTGAAPWPRPELNLDGQVTAYPRRAGVSSFGAGGANVHLVLEEYEEVDAPAVAAGPAPDRHDEVFLLSARTKERLAVLAERVAEHLRDGARADDTTGPSLRSLAWTSQTGRRELTERLAVVAGSLPELAEGLRAFAEGREAPGVHTGTAARTGVPRWQGDELVEAARAWLAGAEVDWPLLWSGPRPRRAAFPTYPFDRARYWLAEPEDAQEAVRDDAHEIVRDGVRERGQDGVQSSGSSTPDTAQDSDQHAPPIPPPTPTPQEAALVRFARPAWENAPSPETAAGTPAPRRALVFAEEPGLPEALAERLAADGTEAVTLTRAQDFARTTDDDSAGYRLEPGNRDHCTRLVADLARRGLEPDALIFCAPENAAGLGSGDLPNSLDRGLHSVAGLTTALLARPGTPRDLRVVYGFTAPTPSSRPYDAAVGAALRTLALEHGRLGAARVAFEGAGAV